MRLASTTEKTIPMGWKTNQPFVAVQVLLVRNILVADISVVYRRFLFPSSRTALGSDDMVTVLSGYSLLLLAATRIDLSLLVIDELQEITKPRHRGEQYPSC